MCVVVNGDRLIIQGAQRTIYSTYYQLYNKYDCVLDGLARQISAPLASADGESTGDPSVASLALALAPWPVRRALKVEKIESVSRDAPPSPRGRAGDVKPALRQSYPRKTEFGRSHTFTL